MSSETIKGNSEKDLKENVTEGTSENGKEGAASGKKINWTLLLEILFLIILALYPMRHLDMGGDLWDVGYNYGNFRYFDVGRIGKTWFFSTYLANALGHLFTLLPYGHTWIGLNVYTGLFSSVLAIMGYLFFTRSLKVSPILTFAGEMVALSMCWCPTALLYNYLTYVLFSASVILLYHGLTKEKKVFLILAGVCLGTNIFVRFSNLPEMGLIVAVWAYAIWKGWESRKAGAGAKKAGKETAEAGKETDGANSGWFKCAMGEIASNTLWCLVGYVIPLILFFGWIAVKYGIGEYVSGIKLLFAMTDTATDYKPTSMIYGLIWPYKAGIHWVVRLAFFAVLASLIHWITEYVPLCFGEGKRDKVRSAFGALGALGVMAVMAFMLYWMFLQRADQPNFTSFLYTSYDPIYWPGTLFLMLGMGIGLIEMVRPGNTKENRFFGAAMIALIILTSLGSNNGIYPSMNHMFLPAPYVLWKMGDFTFYCMKKLAVKPRSKAEFRPGLVPACVSVWAFLLVCIMQFFLFGRYFVFCEGTGMKEKGYEMSNNPVLKGVQMSQERALYISDVSYFVQEMNLTGQEVILHGRIPALAFYLEMPPAFHSWNDLDSFSYETMQETLEDLMEDVSNGSRAKPIVIADRDYAEYGPIKPGEDSAEENEQDLKWQLIQRYMGLYGYEEIFRDGRFVMWQAME